jgi:hypothetical protein
VVLHVVKGSEQNKAVKSGFLSYSHRYPVSGGFLYFGLKPAVSPSQHGRGGGLLGNPFSELGRSTLAFLLCFFLLSQGMSQGIEFRITCHYYYYYYYYVRIATFSVASKQASKQNAKAS